MRKWIATIALASALPALLAGCGNDPAAAGGKGREKKEGKGGEAREVRLATAEEGRLSRTVDVSGTLAAEEQTTLGFKVAGRVEKVYVDIGSRVRRGQAVARLAPVDFELRVRQSESALQQARSQLGLPADAADNTVVPEQTAGVKQAAATLKQNQLTRDRMARLFEQQLIPRSDLDAAEASLGVAEGRYQEAIETARTRQGLLAQRRSELELARQQLADSVVTAPFDGAIRDRLANAGDYLAVGTPVAVLVRVHPLRLRLAVPEREAAGVRVGQEVAVTVEGDPAPGPGRVVRASARRSARTTARCMVEAEVPNPDGPAAAGLVCQGRDRHPTAATAVIVPASALVTFAGVEKVMRSRTARRRAAR